MIGLEHYLTVAATLFVIGIFGLFLNRKNVIILLMSIELMLLGGEHQPCGLLQFPWAIWSGRSSRSLS